MLREAIKATFTFRGDQLPAAIWEVLASNATLSVWKNPVYSNLIALS